MYAKCTFNRKLNRCRPVWYISEGRPVRLLLHSVQFILCSCYLLLCLRARLRRTKYPMTIIIIVGTTIMRIWCILISSAPY